MLIACPHCGVHTRRAAVRCAFCRHALRRSASKPIAQTAAAVVLGLATAGAKPPSPAPPTPTDSSDTVRAAIERGDYATACRELKRKSVDSDKSAQAAFDAAACFEQWADEGNDPVSRSDLLYRAMLLYDEAFLRAQGEPQAATPSVDTVHAARERARVKREKASREAEPMMPDPVPVYGVPASPMCGCTMPASPSGAPATTSVLLLVLWMLRRQAGIKSP